MMLLIFFVIFVIVMVLIAVWIYKCEIPNNFRKVYNQSEYEKIYPDKETTKKNIPPKSAHSNSKELTKLSLNGRTKICKKCNLTYWSTTITECTQCGNPLEIKKLISYQEIWDKGEDSYSEPEYKLFKLKGGERFNGILDGCTVCPTGNSSCHESFDIVLQGFHPDRGLTPKAILICSMGIDKEDSVKCVLNK